MADRQMAGITGNATMRVPITGNVNVGGSAIRELRFMPRSAFPDVGRSDVLYIDTLGECIYYWNGGEYVQLSGGGSGTDNYNALQNRPKINNVTLEGEQTSSDLGLQSSIDDLSSIRSGATAGNTALQPEDIDTLPTDGSSNPVSSGGTYNFVNSSIATNTAYFIGTFASVAELEAYSGTVTNNDYAFVTSTDSAGNTLYNRYKYNAATQAWSFEYAVNNTAFTAAQWAAIQSGMTAADKTKLDGIETGANKTVIDAAPTSGSSNAVSSGGVYTALIDKQDTIADLSDIRSGASAGATAVQTIQIDGTAQTKTNGVVNLPAYPTTLPASDTTSTYSSSGTAPVNGTAVAAALGTLDVASVGGTGKVISAISETNGKISATETTMDTTPTANSTKPVTSGGVAESQAAQDAEIAWNANQGVKNLFPYGDLTGITTNFSDKPFSLQAGDYKLSFQISATTGSYAIRVKDASNNSIFYETGSNSATTKTYDMTLSANAATITFYSSVSNNFTNIMIRPSAITDSTFVPYALPNPTLTPAVIKSVDEGSKNKLPITIQSQTVNTVSFTVNSDGSITANGTVKGGNAFLNLETLIGDKYIGMILSGGTASLKICISKSGSGQIAVYSESSEGVVIPDNATNALFLFAPNGTVLTNVTVKPMICTAADWAVSQKFVPYCPTNRELYKSKADVSLKPNITSSTSITAYADTFANGNYTAFFTSASLPSDKPASDNCFVEIFVYSTSTAMVRVTPTGTAYAGTYYEITKVSGTWRDWYKFTGTVVT